MRSLLSSKVFPSSLLAGLILAAAFLLLAATGCGDGRGTRIPVSGTISIDGKPLEHGSITFLPVAKGDGARPGGASIEKGRFQVSSFTPNDGLLIGEYQVMVDAVEPINELTQRRHAPKKYANPKASGLTIVVSKDLEEVNYELTWEGSKQSKPFVEKL